MLAPILGGTTYTFGLILCVALFGIGFGGIAYNYLFIRFRPTWASLAITCGCEGLFTIIPYALGDRLALLAARRYQSAGNFFELVCGWTVVLSIVVLPAAFISGVQFPLLTGLLGSGRRTVSDHLGLRLCLEYVGGDPRVAGRWIRCAAVAGRAWPVESDCRAARCSIRCGAGERPATRVAACGASAGADGGYVQLYVCPRTDGRVASRRHRGWPRVLVVRRPKFRARVAE